MRRIPVQQCIELTCQTIASWALYIKFLISAFHLFPPYQYFHDTACLISTNIGIYSVSILNAANPSSSWYGLIPWFSSQYSIAKSVTRECALPWRLLSMELRVMLYQTSWSFKLCSSILTLVPRSSKLSLSISESVSGLKLKGILGWNVQLLHIDLRSDYMKGSGPKQIPKKLKVTRVKRYALSSCVSTINSKELCNSRGPHFDAVHLVERGWWDKLMAQCPRFHCRYLLGLSCQSHCFQKHAICAWSLDSIKSPAASPFQGILIMEQIADFDRLLWNGCVE